MYGEPISRWTGQILPTRVSPLDFYERIRILLLETNFPGMEFARVTRRERGWLSAKRTYLRIRYNTLFFDICAFPLGGRLMVSWWLHCDPPGIVDLFTEIPVVGFLLKGTIKAATYMGVDRNAAFQHSVDQAIRQVVNELIEDIEFDFGFDEYLSADDTAWSNERERFQQ